MKASDTRKRKSLSRLLGNFAALLFLCSVLLLLSAETTHARTKPVVEMGDPDIGNEKPRSGPSNASHAQLEASSRTQKWPEYMNPGPASRSIGRAAWISRILFALRGHTPW